MNATHDNLMQHLEANLALLFGGPTFHPLAPAPLAPLASLPESVPAAAFSEDAK